MEHPILFNSEMVRAILEGRKTQTRRLVDTKYINANPDAYKLLGMYENNIGKLAAQWKGDDHVRDAYSRYGKAGDKLWVRETWAETVNINQRTNWPGRPHIKCVDYPEIGAGKPCIIFRADGETDWVDDDGSPTENSYWKPSIHMPRWASRIQLEVTAIRVERLQDITLRDKLAEGMEYTSLNKRHGELTISDVLLFECEDTNFRDLWDSINAKSGFSWDANPWVWIIEFKPQTSQPSPDAAREVTL